MLLPTIWGHVELFCPSILRHILSRCLLLACLLVLCVGGVSGTEGCRLLESNIAGLYRKGDIIIGGLFPVHVYRTYPQLTFRKPPTVVTCNTFVPLTFQWVQSLLLAVEEINSSGSLLPNVTLGVQVSDSCASPARSVEGGSWLLTGGDGMPVPNFRCLLRSSPLLGVVGDSSSGSSISVARLLGLYSYPQVPLSICSPSCPPGFRKAAFPGRPVCCFQCVLCPSGEISNQTDSLDCLRCPWNQWPNIEQSQCLLKAIEFLSFEESLGTTLLATSVASSTIPVVLLALFIHYKTTPIVRANNYTLSCLLLASLSLCFLCSVIFIGYPQPEKCLLRQVTFGMVFTLCVSCILAKTITVVIAFNATKPGSSLKKWTGSRVSYCVIGLSVLIQLVVCTVWLSLYPPFPENDTGSQVGVIIIGCNEGSPTGFWSMLGYLGLLATVSFIVAFLARRLPDSFNEAKFITFSMLAFLSVWISYIPASLSARGKYTVAMEIFAILSSSWGLVICIFVPKCFIIIFRPELNTKNSLMGRGKKPS
ncbi:vomeronasal type-2 receptor 26-like [Pelodytes ibericus]